MSIDHSAVGGIGIILTDEMISALIESGAFSQDLWDEDEEECFKGFPARIERFGSEYSGNIGYALIVKGRGLSDIELNAAMMLGKLVAYGVEITHTDIQTIEKVYIS